ncbi:response regulator transcription factor [Paenibacillus lemnae]|uniref:Response regulator n=1 Tax=Paenibacillus lemnae TaxID=1330551 RepID=A0A848MC27_PAELE|nr:response regulator [Paenibacillus lemnae]NMO98056.1 response regulator [Paenibacillus lemnae]
MLDLLIVDDEELIREEIRSKIIRIGNPSISNIHFAVDGQQALHALRELKPDIVISDIRMPNLDGLSLIRECYTAYPQIKFIVLSGYGDYGYVREAFKYGIVDYLLKPVRLSELESQLSHAIQECTEHKAHQNAAEHVSPSAFPEAESANVDMNAEGISSPTLTGSELGGDEGEARPKSLIGLVKQYIADRPYGDVCLSEISNVVSMNYTYFSSWFKEETGWTFSSYMMKLKMDEAKRLLENPTLRVNEVASRVGYDNIYHFSRAFKNYSGLSPKEYRKQTVLE